MKITSLRDVENYIFYGVVVPLKKLEMDTISIDSPLIDSSGRQWTFKVVQERLSGRYTRNYQRDRARLKLKDLVLISNGYEEYVIADYDPRRHNVNIYHEILRDTFGNMVLNKIWQLFESNTPFTKIKLVDGYRDMQAPPDPQPRPRRHHE